MDLLNVYLTFTMLCVCCLQLSVVVVVLAVFAQLVLKRWFQVRERSHLSLSLSKPSTMAFLPFTISISLSISSVSCCCSSADFKSSDIETQKLYFNELKKKKKTETVELEADCVTGLLQQSAQFFLHTRLLLLQLLSPGSGRTTWKKVTHYIRGTSILQIKNIHF